MNSTYTANRQTHGLACCLNNFLHKAFHFTKSDSYTGVKDYSAFNSLTAYEKTIVDRLRGDGLSDAEIKKCLAEM